MSGIYLVIIPSTIVQPFAIDNDLQVIVIAIFIGIVLLILGDKVSMVHRFCDEAGSVINQMMALVCKALPLFVYLGVTNLLLSNMLAQVYLVSRVFVLSLVGAAITISITIVRTLIVTKIPFSKLFSAQLPSLIINLTTSSQMSALPESMKCCKEKWGIDERFTDFGLPLGIVVYMPNGAIMLGSIVWVLTDMSLGAVDAMMLTKTRICRRRHCDCRPADSRLSICCSSNSLLSVRNKHVDDAACGYRRLNGRLPAPGDERLLPATGTFDVGMEIKTSKDLRFSCIAAD
ncbi:MAG: cation:dicarboxylase symporter family transporter [Treponema sp.]|nr:cation:dicarboxylase symporter family transporter [Treponema sp.]